VIGPIVFVVSWAVAGASTSGYSAVDGAISDLAAAGASTQAAVTVSFVVFGIGVIAFGFALRAVLTGRAWIAAAVTGACTIGVAATPLHGWSGDEVHGAFAVLGYTAIVALPLLAAAPLAATGRRGWARASAAVAVTSAVCLVATASGTAHGLWQRLGLTVADAWIVVTASYLVARPTTDPTGCVSIDRSPWR
jgi:hypothetical protein